MKKLAWFIALPILISLAVSWLVIKANPARQFDEQTVQKLDRMMATTLQKTKAPGMIMGVWVPGRGEYVKAIGLADVKAKAPMPTDKIFRIGSLTKTFTGTVILQLVDEGKLKLDDKVDRFLPWVQNAKLITIRQLLNMTSGLHSYTETEEFGRKFEADPMQVFFPEELVRIGGRQPADFAPGKGFHYSNTNTIVLGMIAEKITGDTLENQIKKRIIDRLGLKQTYFPTDEKMPEAGYIHGYMLEEGKYKDWSIENASWGWAAGEMISNLFDLKRYITALGNGTFLSPALQKERLVPAKGAVKPEDKTLRYCLAAFTWGGFVGHNGSLPGYEDIAVYDPESKAVIIMMVNIQMGGKYGTLEMLADVYRILYPEKKF